jgi:hypothetical protein
MHGVVNINKTSKAHVYFCLPQLNKVFPIDSGDRKALTGALKKRTVIIQFRGHHDADCGTR